MGYTPQEFDVAFDTATKKYTFMTTPTAKLFLFNFDKRVSENKKKKFSEREPYGLQIRHALTDSNIKGKVQRKAYGSLVGLIYGKHGNYVAQKYRNNPNLRPAVPQFPKDQLVVEEICEPNGQRAWVL